MNQMYGKYSRHLLRMVWAGLLLSGVLGACDAEDSCVSFSTNEYDLGFYMINERGRAEAGPFNFDKIEVLGSDSIFYVRTGGGIKSLRLALSPVSDTSVFIFSFEDKKDTLMVAYRRNFRLLSPDCGVEALYQDLNVFYHSFDSVHTINTELSEINKGFDVQIFSLEPCASPFTNLFRAGFKSKNEEGEITENTVNFDEVKATWSDSVFFARTQNGTRQIRLALDPGADQSVFTFRNRQEMDTLVVNYQRNFRIFSPECGVEAEFVNLSVARSTFDSVSLISKEISETATQELDVEIFEFK